MRADKAKLESKKEAVSYLRNPFKLKSFGFQASQKASQNKKARHSHFFESLAIIESG